MFAGRRNHFERHCETLSALCGNDEDIAVYPAGPKSQQQNFWRGLYRLFCFCEYFPRLKPRRGGQLAIFEESEAPHKVLMSLITHLPIILPYTHPQNAPILTKLVVVPAARANNNKPQAIIYFKRGKIEFQNIQVDFEQP